MTLSEQQEKCRTQSEWDFTSAGGSLAYGNQRSERAAGRGFDSPTPDDR